MKGAVTLSRLPSCRPDAIAAQTATLESSAASSNHDQSTDLHHWTNPDQHSAAQALASLGFKSQTLALAKVSWFGGGFTGTQSLGLVGHCQMVVLLISEILATAPAILKLTTL